MGQKQDKNSLLQTSATGLVFIVDDHPENIRVLGNILRNQGYKLAIAADGLLALQMINQKPPDLILLDVMMPEMDGYEVCEKIKSNSKTKDIPVIFLTAKGELEDKIKGFQVGGADYITKPFEATEILARVQTHLKLKKATDYIRNENDRLEVLLEERTKDLIKSERQAAFAQFMQGIIHNLRGPISAIMGRASLIQINKHDVDMSLQEEVRNLEVYKRIFGEIWEGADFIVQASDELNSMIKSMMIKSRQDKKESVLKKDLNEILRKELEFLEVDLEFKNRVDKEIRLCNKNYRLKSSLVRLAKFFRISSKMPKIL